MSNRLKDNLTTKEALLFNIKELLETTYKSGGYGANVYTGSGQPIIDGRDGDVYLDVEQGVFYIKENNIWNIKYGPNYIEYTQSTAASIWTVEHNFGKYPQVTILDNNNMIISACVEHIDINTVEVRFYSASAPINKSGKLILTI